VVYPFYSRPVYRLLSGLFGLCLAGIGIYGLFFAGPSSLLQNFGAGVLVMVGANMVLAAVRAKESWLSRIGPLP
jgi:hypothetical protein